MAAATMSTRPVLSEDARTVREVRAALERAGYRGHPFPPLRQRDPSWTRERWDLAEAELASQGQGPGGPLAASSIQ